VTFFFGAVGGLTFGVLLVLVLALCVELSPADVA
jgi:hypothetical protein